MRTWWISAALAACCLGQVTMVRAQQGGPLPEPAPVAVTAPGVPPAVPGPLTGMGAPGGPGLDLSLPATIPTAWQRGPMPEMGFFAHAGALSLQRQRPGSTPFVLNDTTTNLDRGSTPILRDTTIALNTGDIGTPMSWGVMGTFGYLFDNAALEVSGFYIGDNDGSAEVANPGRLTLFFHNPPVGLEGNNGMWLQADRVKATLRDSLASGEINYRWWSRSTYGLLGAEGILGIRYMGVQETASIFTDDDGLTVRDINLQPDPLRQATVSVRSHNRIIGPQFGMEGYAPIFPCAALGIIAKGAWGANFLEVDTRVSRGDGFVGRSQKRNDIIFSHLYEVNAFLDLVAFERVRLRAGYTALWVLNVNEPLRNIDYDLFNPGPKKDDGSIFFHGPMIELQVIF